MNALYKTVTPLLIMIFFMGTSISAPEWIFEPEELEKIEQLARRLEQDPWLQESEIRKLAKEMKITIKELRIILQAIMDYTPTHLSGNKKEALPDNTDTQPSISARNVFLITLASFFAMFVLRQVYITDDAKRRVQDPQVLEELDERDSKIRKLNRILTAKGRLLDKMLGLIGVLLEDNAKYVQCARNTHQCTHFSSQAFPNKEP